MIFGAGINQLELIREAKNLGVISIVVDPSENPPGKAEADVFYQVEGKDYQTTKDIAQKHQVNGIVTGQMEKPMRLMAKLAQEMGYIFHTPEIVEKSLNKDLMKTAFMEQQVACAKGVVFRKGEKISESKIEEFSFPLIIKPVDAFSSRGVMKVFSFDELKSSEEETRSYSAESTILVEEFLEGREFSVESITYNGQTTIIQVTEKFITPYPNTVEMAHLQPARLTSEEKREIEELVKKAILAIGIDNSASHAEVMLTKNGPYMIEIGARLGGDFIASHLTKASTGVSMDKAAIQVALGLEPILIPAKKKWAMIKYVAFEEGKKIHKICPISDISQNEGFVFAHFSLKEGDIVKRINSSADRAACILFESKDLDTLLIKIKKAEEVVKQFTVLI